MRDQKTMLMENLALKDIELDEYLKTVGGACIENDVRIQEVEIDKVWVVTVFWVARTHLARPDLGPQAHVCASPF